VIRRSGWATRSDTSQPNPSAASSTTSPIAAAVSFVGSCPFPPRRDQAGTAIMVRREMLRGAAAGAAAAG